MSMAEEKFKFSFLSLKMYTVLAKSVIGCQSFDFKFSKMYFKDIILNFKQIHSSIFEISENFATENSFSRAENRRRKTNLNSFFSFNRSPLQLKAGKGFYICTVKGGFFQLRIYKHFLSETSLLSK